MINPHSSTPRFELSPDAASEPPTCCHWSEMLADATDPTTGLHGQTFIEQAEADFVGAVDALMSYALQLTPDLQPNTADGVLDLVVWPSDDERKIFASMLQDYMDTPPQT